jgi:hypothetical protein
MAQLTVTPAIIPEPIPAKFNLELTAEEVAFLSILLNRIGGSASTTLRKHADSIVRAIFDGNEFYEQVFGDGGSHELLDERAPVIYFAGGSAEHKAFIELVNHFKIMT